MIHELKTVQMFYISIILPVIKCDKNNILLQKISRSKEEARSSTHDEGSSMEVDHNCPLLGVKLWRVDVEVETVLISHGFRG